MPTTVDIVLALVLVAGTALVEHVWFWPRFRGEVASGDATARRRGYRRIIAVQWTLVAAALWIWIANGRSAAGLRMTAPSGWRLATSAALVALMIGFVVYQLRSIRRVDAARRAAAGSKLGEVAFILPHARADLGWFLALSATAGICEELLYRGYLVWLLSRWIGVAAAFVAVVLLFGAGHLYLGRRGATRATLVGAVLTALVALTGWLVPVMIIHALVDVGSGIVGYMLLGAARDAAVGAAARVAPGGAGDEFSPRAPSEKGVRASSGHT